MTRQTSETLQEALAHLLLLQEYGKRDLGDQVVVDAICMRLSAGIESLATLNPVLREQLFGNDWPLMWGMRNRIAHGYMLVDAAIVQETLRLDVPTIIERIQTNLNQP
ncbi:MAG: DUF86 domain-containing protein [Micrococcales bacterium]|nr:DUF86 domain-containing protein [Micrococcales bacterium]